LNWAFSNHGAWVEVGAFTSRHASTTSPRIGAAYVRVKGADPIQQERMIGDYVDAYGSITRSQAAGLCQVSPTQARATLKRMVDREDLQLVGERRGAKYVRP
jgi:hypothetical protein